MFCFVFMLWLPLTSASCAMVSLSGWLAFLSKCCYFPSMLESLALSAHSVTSVLLAIGPLCPRDLPTVAALPLRDACFTCWAACWLGWYPAVATCGPFSACLYPDQLSFPFLYDAPPCIGLLFTALIRVAFEVVVPGAEGYCEYLYEGPAADSGVRQGAR